MNTLQHSEVFFLISSVGFVILWIVVAVLLYYLIRAVNTWNRIMEKVEDDIDKLGDTTKEMLEDMRDSSVFRFLFGKRSRRKSLK